MSLRLGARLASAAGTAALLLTAVPGPAVAGPAPRTDATAPPPARTVHCVPFSATVAMAPGAPADQRIAGTLCGPRAGRSTTVQLLLHGGTYDRTYWTVRGTPRAPSYVEAAARSGHAALAIDRLGTGRSSAPPSSRYTDRTHEFVVHQVVQRLRDRGFGKVVLVGNSFGATLARMVAVHHPGDVDGLVLTGEGAPPSAAAFKKMGSLYGPARRHPLLAGRGLDDGYLALRPGAKAEWFYAPETADPRVVVRDELHPEPDVYPADPGYGDTSLNKRIRVPVFVVVGSDDRLICGDGGSDCTSSATLRAAAAPLYGPAARLETYVVPHTGHVLNLHRTTALWYGRVQEWIDRRVAGGS
ncbi:alpha/beta hydrolase [Streptomyces sp. S186]|uniref:alpha/beta hydrolase n=1 Tax=Streptomyces sp. S186 TaxID=3434395 RepID=UPI003F67C935